MGSLYIFTVSLGRFGQFYLVDTIMYWKTEARVKISEKSIF